MFFKKLNFLVLIFLLSFISIPYYVKAYSDKIMIGGENIGITLNSKGVIVVGLYEIEGTSPGKEAGLEIGDKITKINEEKITSIDEMSTKISIKTEEKINITFIRNNKEKRTSLKLYKDEKGVYKTGLYVKDSITGIGTLTYVDPKTKIFGALGHEIQEQTTGKILEVKDGKIFSSEVTGVIPSSNGNPGEKEAEIKTDNEIGSIKSNTKQGIFGKYEGKVKENNIYPIANPNEIKIGEAKILTVIDNNKVKDFSIKITEIINTQDKNKNFVFETTDKELLSKTNGIIQGMSGSPILQNNKIIGAVTHVVVDNTKKGYGIFITNMLEEGEK